MIIKLRPFIAFLSVLLIFSACQKEFSIEDGNTGIITGTALFSFSGAPGNCTSPLINGIFQAGKALDTSNLINAQVNVDSIGTYNISTTSINGISFSAAGNFTSVGPQNITFTATGIPTASGSFNFTLGTGGCSIAITVIPGIPGSTDSTDDCKECIYLPCCPGTKYEYVDTSLNPPPAGNNSIVTRNSNFLSATDTVIDGNKYKRILLSDGTSSFPSYVNCSNGETRSISYNIQSSTSGNILVAVKSIELKANAAVGASWSDTSAFAGGNTLYRKHTILQKGFSRTVLGVNFNDVIKVSVDQSILYVDPPVGLMQSGVTEYYIAKGIGIIETITYAEDSSTNKTFVGYHSVLKSYLIP